MALVATVSSGAFSKPVWLRFEDKKPSDLGALAAAVKVVNRRSGASVTLSSAKEFGFTVKWRESQPSRRFDPDAITPPVEALLQTCCTCSFIYDRARSRCPECGSNKWGAGSVHHELDAVTSE